MFFIQTTKQNHICIPRIKYAAQECHVNSATNMKYELSLCAQNTQISFSVKCDHKFTFLGVSVKKLPWYYTLSAVMYKYYRCWNVNIVP